MTPSPVSSDLTKQILERDLGRTVSMHCSNPNCFEDSCKGECEDEEDDRCHPHCGYESS
jgi:hypothetical protein